jgi:hypothetical protein
MLEIGIAGPAICHIFRASTQQIHGLFFCLSTVWLEFHCIAWGDLFLGVSSVVNCCYIKVSNS